MSRVFLLATCFLNLLILFAVQDAAEGFCSEDLGTCDANCKANCNMKHPDGEGSCYTTLKGENVCRCYYTYQCSSKCLTGLGQCTPQCDQNCCAANCGDRYPGGKAYCDPSVGSSSSLCQCQHDCPP